MRLRELKCENCGATVKVEENASKAKCEFCKTEFAVEDAYHAGYKFEKGRIKAQNEQMEDNLEQMKEINENFKKEFNASSLPKPILIFIIIFAIFFIFIITKIITSNNDFDIRHNDFDIRQFNGNYEFYVGTISWMQVGRLIDEVSTNNKKDEKHQLTLKYKEIETKDPEQMKEIKKQLEDWTDYEVSFEYDEDGYIYIVTIEELNKD